MVAKASLRTSPKKALSDHASSLIKKRAKRFITRVRRVREHLTPAEIDSLIHAAKQVGRHGFRDAIMILIAYRHGLRVSELVSLRWSNVDLKQGLLYVVRLKNGIASHHPLFGPE